MFAAAHVEPYQSRVLEERDQLRDRWKQLTLFIGSETYARLRSDEQRRLVCQQHIMSIYLNILEERIAAWPPLS